MLVQDAMVLIHLAKVTLLATACKTLGPVLVPPLVRDEVAAGRAKGHPDAALVEALIEQGAIEVRAVRRQPVLAQAKQLGLQGGEAEAVALCWQEGVERLATDDDNVRRKRAMLGITVVGSPAILLELLRRGAVDGAKFREAVEALGRIGWFSRAVLDQVLMEASRWEKR